MRTGSHWRSTTALAQVLLLTIAGQALGGSEGTHTVRVGNRILKLQAATWNRMANPDAVLAENFEAMTTKRGESWPQVLTIFKLPMSADRKTGIQITKTEYVEPFVAHAGKVTILIRVDRGRYWVLSRQTFGAVHDLGIDVSDPKPRYSPQEERAMIRAYQPQIDSTRAWINVNL